MKFKKITIFMFLIFATILFASCENNATKNEMVVNTVENLEESKDLTNEGEKEESIQSNIEAKEENKKDDAVQLSFETIKTVLDYDIRDLSDTYESLKFGKYEQDNNIENGKEDIEWVVLSKEGNNFLLLSKYILDKLEFNEENKFIEWNDSTLRNWLNASFYNEAFDDKEKEAIMRKNYPNYAIASGTLDIGRNAYEGYSSDDLVSLLGYQELVKYMGKQGNNERDQFHNRRLSAKSTAYARAKTDQYGIVLDVEKLNVWSKGCSPWWLRSTFAVANGNMTNCAAKVMMDSTITNASVNESYTGVRPVIYIDISKIPTDKAHYMLSFNKDRLVGQSDVLETEKTMSINSWEMEYFVESLTSFKHDFDDLKKQYVNRADRKYKPAYTMEADGSTIFTYGLRDIDKDNVKELLIYNKDNLFRVYKLANKYFEGTPEYNTGFYPIMLEVIYLWIDNNGQETAILYEDNFINSFAVWTYTEDFSGDKYYNQASEELKKDWFDANNYTEYSYHTMYLKDEEFEWTEMYDYSTNDKEGLGDYNDINNNERRISKAEADIIFAKHGTPVVLRDETFTLK